MYMTDLQYNYESLLCDFQYYLTIIDCSRPPKNVVIFRFLITCLIPCSLTTLMDWAHSSSLLGHLQLYHGCQFTMVTAWQMQGTAPKESDMLNKSDYQLIYIWFFPISSIKVDWIFSYVLITVLWIKAQLNLL